MATICISNSIIQIFQFNLGQASHSGDQYDVNDYFRLEDLNSIEDSPIVLANDNYQSIDFSPDSNYIGDNEL